LSVRVGEIELRHGGINAAAGELWYQLLVGEVCSVATPRMTDDCVQMRGDARIEASEYRE
jgi:hypothetical protein